ncbi:MAG TPA: efflux RND transporter permease subunit, partial [bacterium]|nr:efflux RND transporter permease subunit [bacterium]
VPLANVVKVREFADSATRNRYDRLRSITISANLAEDYTLGEALEFLRGVVRDKLDNRPGIAYGGQSREFVESSDALLMTFLVSLLLVYLVLAAQFESFLQPLVILLTVPLALFGGLLGLKLGGGTLNIYSQIGMVILIGLAAKNGILIVEFANQLRDDGRKWREAIIEASVLRLRPILMTGLSTSLGALPLVLAAGAGAEGRAAIGLVVLFGVTIATFTTLLVVPGTYGLIARFTGSPQARSRRLDAQLGARPVAAAAGARQVS